jgi:hypothetical protein
MRISDLNKTKNINESIKSNKIAKKSSLTEGRQLNEYAVAAVPPIIAGTLELIAFGLGYAGRRALIRNVGKHGGVLKAFVNLYNYISGPDVDYDAETKKANKEFIDKLSQTAVNTFSALQNSKEIDIDNIQDYLDSIKNTETTKLTPAQRNAISAWNTISRFEAPVKEPDAPVIEPDAPVIEPDAPDAPATPYPDDPITIPKPDVKPDWWPEGIPYNPDAPDSPTRKDPEPQKPDPEPDNTPGPNRIEPKPDDGIPPPVRWIPRKPDKEDEEPAETDPKPDETKPDETDPKPDEPKPDETDPKPDETKPAETDPKPAEIKPKPDETKPDTNIPTFPLPLRPVPFNPQTDDDDQGDPDEKTPDPAAEPGTITQPLPSTEFNPPVRFNDPSRKTDPLEQPDLRTKSDPKNNPNGRNRTTQRTRPRSQPRTTRGFGMPTLYMKSPLLPIADPLELSRVVPNRP